MCFWTYLDYLRNYCVWLLVPLADLIWWSCRYCRRWEWFNRSFTWCWSWWCRDVQLYCKRNDELATNVIKDLKALLFEKRYILQEKHLNNLDHAKPTIVVSFKTSRPLADVSEATRDISHLLNNKMALIIFQLTTDDPLKDSCSELVRGYSDYASLGLLVDLGFRNNQGRYCLNKNSYALNLIANFLRK